MGFHLTVRHRASYVEKVVGRTKVELERQIPISSQFGLCRLDIRGLNITFRRRPRRWFATTEPQDPFLRSLSCPEVSELDPQAVAVSPIKVAA